jgi:hypothetical protein
VAEPNRDVLVVTSTNNTPNDVIVFKLATTGAPALSYLTTLPTGGNGGASGNAGSLQFQDGLGAVANFASNTVTELIRDGNFVRAGGTIKLAPGCVNPVSVAISDRRLYVAGADCAESHAWPSGALEGMAALPDASAGQIAVGETWAAVTLKSGSVLQLPLAANGNLTGTENVVTLPSDANNTPLGAAFWGDLLGFNPAHSAESFALVNRERNVFPVLGPQPAFPTNAPCWLAKGRGNIWYSGNSPGDALSIFFSDAQGGVFYKSVPLPGSPTDVTVSPDLKWLAVIYTATADNLARVAVFAIDRNGDLSPVATSNPVSGVSTFNGVAFSL